MSRFNAQAQKGYYKTPTHLLPVISRYVSCSDPENARVLDPCAGEGEAHRAPWPWPRTLNIPDLRQ